MARNFHSKVAVVNGGGKRRQDATPRPPERIDRIRKE